MQLSWRAAARAALAALFLFAMSTAAVVADGDINVAWYPEPGWHSDGVVRCLPADASGPARVEIDAPSIWAIGDAGDQKVFWRPWIYYQAEATGWYMEPNWQSYQTTANGPVTDPGIFLSSPNAFWARGTYEYRVTPGQYWVLFEYWWQGRGTEPPWTGPVYQWAGGAGGNNSNYFQMGDIFAGPRDRCDFTPLSVTLFTP